MPAFQGCLGRVQNGVIGITSSSLVILCTHVAHGLLVLCSSLLTLGSAMWLALANRMLVNVMCTEDVMCVLVWLGLSSVSLPVPWQEHIMCSHCSLSVGPRTGHVEQMPQWPRNILARNKCLWLHASKRLLCNSQSQYRLATGMVVQRGEYSRWFCGIFLRW